MEWSRRAVTGALMPLVVFAVLTSVSVPGQQPPTFRAAVEAVVLDVSVLDRDRRPLRGLTAADFTILEDGRPQTIQTFTAVDIPDPPAEDAARAAWTREVMPDVRSNEEFKDGRVVVVVMDDGTPMPAREVPHARALGRRMIETLAPRDLAAVVFPVNARLGQDFTRDKARLLAAVDSFNGALDGMGGPTAKGYSMRVPFDEFTPAAATLYTATLNCLTGVAQQLAALPDRRKALVLVSVGVPLDLGVMAPATNLAGTGDAAGLSRDLVQKLQESFRAAQLANVAFYALDPGGLRASFGAGSPGRINREFLQTVAVNTGGLAVVDTNDAGPGISQILVENGSYYLLGYVPSNGRSEGRFRRIDVRVNRPGVTVRSRNGYFERKADAARTTAARTPSLVDVMAEMVPEGGLALGAAAAPFARAAGREVDVAVVAAIRQPRPPSAGEDSIEVLVLAYDPQGQRRASDRVSLDIRFRPDRPEDAHYEVLSQLALKPGRYQLRLGAHSRALGRNGSVFLDLDVPDFSTTDLSMSGLVLTVAPLPQSRPTGRLASFLPVTPTAERSFGQDDHAAAFLRIYQGGRGPIAATPISVKVTDDRGAVVFDTGETLAPDRFARGRAADYRIELPLARLRTGPYLLTVEAARPGARVRREIRFAVR